jgi:hypothetical protein
MPTPTYVPLATATLASSASSVTFSSIPATYRDLIVVVNGTNANSVDNFWRANGDSGFNYSYVRANNSGNSPVSSGFSGGSEAWAGRIGPDLSTIVLQFMDYSANNKHKTVLTRSNVGATTVTMEASRWANNSVITSIAIIASGSFNSGSTFNLYGIAS